MHYLNFFGQFYGDLGIPIHSRNFGIALKNQINDVRLLQLYECPHHDIDAGVPITTDVDPTAPGLVFWYPYTYERYSMFPFNIGYYIFEYDTIPTQYVNEINELDLICTASQWGVDTLKKNKVKIPCAVVPGGVDTKYFNSKNRNPRTDKFVFLNVGKGEERKNTKTVVRAFNIAFEGSQDVELMLSIDNHDIRNFSAENYLAEIANDLKYPIDNIRLVHYVNDIRTLYNQAHCAVFATRAEGIGLPITESIACGVPTIVPYHTGTTMYVRDENSIVLQKGIEDPVYDPHFFPVAGQFGTWYTQDIDELIERMHWVYNNYSMAEVTGRCGEKWMHHNFSWELSAKKFVKEVDAML